MCLSGNRRLLTLCGSKTVYFLHAADIIASTVVRFLCLNCLLTVFAQTVAVCASTTFKGALLDLAWSEHEVCDFAVLSEADGGGSELSLHRLKFCEGAHSACRILQRQAIDFNVSASTSTHITCYSRCSS